ncbi:hypothetical protein OROHE_022335 [Orobanche hederae]
MNLLSITSHVGGFPDINNQDKICIFVDITGVETNNNCFSYSRALHLFKL